MKLLLRGLSALLVALLLVLALAWHALRPRPGEWSLRLPIGPVAVAASVPTLLRWSTHPLARGVLDGRRLRTASGDWQLATAADGTLSARCAPCALQLAPLGAAPLTVSEAQLTLRALGGDRYAGLLQLGTTAGVQLPWSGVLADDGLRLKATLAPTPVARLVALLLPAEAARAQIAGSLALALEARLDGGGLQLTKIVPRLDGVHVEGLGTEALVDADALARCRPQPADGRIGGWLPGAVLAAEDQGFHEHPGYRVDAWLAAWRHNDRAPQALQGASTVTMQLAKILYTGDERSAQRKLREWLYAVEMERTLGKGRILQLYLALVPWGDGVCGAEAASRHHLGKPAQQLRPREAAWLASLLVNPDLQRRRWDSDEAAARERVAFVLRGMRKLPRERRDAELDALQRWQPPIGRRVIAPPATP